jgi:hypothetical protein
MEKKIFQSGPIIDRMVFEDGSVAQGQEVSGGALDGELVGGTDNLQILKVLPLLNLQDMHLLRVLIYHRSSFNSLRCSGGVITYEDGSSARFQNLILLSRRKY